MKRIIVLLLLLWQATVFAQKDFDFGFDFLGQGSSWTATIPLATLDTSTAFPAPYDDFCLYLNTGQIARIINPDSLVLVTSTTAWKITFDVKRDTGSRYWGMRANGGGFTTNLAFRRTGAINELIVGDSVYNVDTIGITSTAWAHYDFQWIGGHLILIKDGVTKVDRVTTMPNIGGGIYAFTLGSFLEVVEDGRANLSGQADFKGLYDNIYIEVTRVTDTIITNVNFNNGVIGQDSANFDDWAGGIQHAHKNGNLYGGYSYMSADNYDGTFVYRDDERKDTCRYFSIPGLVQWVTGIGYSRVSPSKLKTNPWDSTEVLIGGAFNGTVDSSQLIGNHIALYSSVSNAITGFGTGIDDDGFVFDMEWLDDSTAVVGGQFDSAGGIPALNIVLVNTNTGVFTAMDTGNDTLSHTVFVMSDTIWVVDGKRVKYWAYGVSVAWTVFYTFAITTQAYTPAISGGDGELFVCIAGSGIWRRAGATLELMTIQKPYLGTVFTVGGFSYDAVRLFNDTLWAGGDYDTLGGVPCGGLSYVTLSDGVVHNGFRLGGLSGGYGAFSLPGGFTLDITNMTEWQGSKIFVGGYRTIDGKKIGSNIFMWDSRGVNALDYGTLYKGQAVTVYNNGAYKDLMVAGDGDEWGGLFVPGYLAGRYSEEHFRDLGIEASITTIPPDIDSAFYPVGITLSAYSPSRRALTVTCDYTIGINGSDKSFNFAKTDSTLLNTNAYWTYNWSGTFSSSDTIQLGDTVFWTANVVDDYGHTWDSSNSFKIFDDADFHDYIVRSGVSDTALWWQTGVYPFIAGLKSDTLYTDITDLQIHASPDTNTALTNVVSSSFKAFTVSSPTFTKFEGFTGDGVADYINYNYNISTDGGSIYTQNSAGYSFYQRVASPNTGGFWCGTFTGTSSYTVLSAGNILFGCNNIGVDGTGATLFRAKCWTVTRTSSTNVQLYANGSLITNAAVTSAAMHNLKMYGLCLNNNGTAGSFTNAQFSIFCIHGGWPAYKVAMFNTRVETLMDYFGKGVQ